MKTIKTPEWLERLWPEVRAAAEELGGWFAGYTRGFSTDAADDVPHDGPPDEWPVWDYAEEKDVVWSDWPEKDQDPDTRVYVEMRTVGDTHGAVVPGMPEHYRYPEFHLGTFAVFRVTNGQFREMAELGGYDPDEVSDNEAHIEDGDHTVVMYML